MSVAAVILAAGFSRRLGRPKQTIEIGGETLVQRAVRVAQRAGLHPVFVVVHPQAEFTDSLKALDCGVVVNQQAEEGMASSIRAGVLAAQRVGSVKGIVLMTCDQVGTPAAHLRALAEDSERLTGSGYAGKIAVPAFFPRSTFDELLALQGDTGARELLRNAAVVWAENLELDVDTEEDIARARILFEQQDLG